jgi:extradiol dioxygenase family protein
MEGRSAPRWVDFDFFGHQISAHLVDDDESVASNPVDGDDVPARHFGVILSWSAFDVLRRRLEEHDVPFLIGPRVRFEGEVGEQATMFVTDPSGNALEFKAFRNPDQVFAR